MSEYQYYEFCRINKPISQEARDEMISLSSRAHISTHGASYVYNYGNFRGKPTQLLLKYFDVFFYINNYGTIKLIFKYKAEQVDINELKKYCIKHVINCEQHNKNVLLEICINNEEGGGWIEGEGLLIDFLPLYKEIKTKNYQFLRLVAAVDDELNGEKQASLSEIVAKMEPLSLAQEAFLGCVEVAY